MASKKFVPNAFVSMKKVAKKTVTKKVAKKTVTKKVAKKTATKKAPRVTGAPFGWSAPRARPSELDKKFDLLREMEARWLPLAQETLRAQQDVAIALNKLCDKLGFAAFVGTEVSSLQDALLRTGSAIKNNNEAVLPFDREEFKARFPNVATLLTSDAVPPELLEALPAKVEDLHVDDEPSASPSDTASELALALSNTIEPAPVVGPFVDVNGEN